MADRKCNNEENDPSKRKSETITIEKTQMVCPLCEDYAEKHAAKPIAIMYCEGACLRGEIARQAANLIGHQLAPKKTVRICLGGAFTKDTGQRNLVKNAPRVIALDGCFIECSTRMMQGVVPDLTPEVIITDTLCHFDKNLFGIDELPEEEIKACAREVAEHIIPQR